MTSASLDEESAHASDGEESFRKRRLSLSTYTNETSSPLPPPSGSPKKVKNETDETVDPTTPFCEESRKLGYEEASPSPRKEEQHHDAVRAQTFRKRRLSLTKTVSSSSFADDHEPGVSRRRASADSVASNQSGGSNGKKEPALVSRTVHAGELVDEDQSHPTPVGPITVLYQQSPPPAVPPLPNSDSKTMLRPKWKRRQTLNLATEVHKLPFAMDVVGTYSCHGVEPVYDEGEEDDQLQGAFVTTSPEKEVVADPPVVTVDSPPDGPPAVMVAKINQDRGGVAFPYGNSPRTALFAVYDGHGQGGELVSQFCLYEIQRRLEKHPQFVDDVETALKETFLAVDMALHHEPLIEPLFAGTTACVALLRDNTFYLANAGDSRAVCARRMKGDDNSTAYMALPLTTDQNPDCPDELARISRAGGYVSLPPAPGLSARVWLDAECTQVGLAMARSLGDHAVGTVGVIAEPVVTQHTVRAEDEFLIVASDGVWEFISSEEASQIVGMNLHRGATTACQALIEVAAARWHQEEGAYRDDITAIVVRLQELWKTEPTNLVEKSSNEEEKSAADSS